MIGTTIIVTIDLGVATSCGDADALAYLENGIPDQLDPLLETAGFHRASTKIEVKHDLG